MHAADWLTTTCGPALQCVLELLRRHQAAAGGQQGQGPVAAAAAAQPAEAAEVAADVVMVAAAGEAVAAAGGVAEADALGAGGVAAGAAAGAGGVAADEEDAGMVVAAGGEEAGGVAAGVEVAAGGAAGGGLAAGAAVAGVAPGPARPILLCAPSALGAPALLLACGSLLPAGVVAEDVTKSAAQAAVKVFVFSKVLRRLAGLPEDQVGRCLGMMRVPVPVPVLVAALIALCGWRHATGPPGCDGWA
jgi:hypothetical protein